jgi:hypothetical protein
MQLIVSDFEKDSALLSVSISIVESSERAVFLFLEASSCSASQEFASIL